MRRLAALACLLLGPLAAAQDLRIYHIDVEQADATTRRSWSWRGKLLPQTAARAEGLLRAREARA